MKRLLNLSYRPGKEILAVYTVADALRDRLEELKGPLFPLTGLSDIEQQGWAAYKTGMDIRFFDMTLDDGRVYRVRVSDITPEREEVS